MNDLGKGIATAAVWLAVGATGYFAESGNVVGVAICAIFATAIIWNR